MATSLDYATLSARVYRNVRGEPNKNPIPNDWQEIAYDPYNDHAGFIAGAYRNEKTKEIVIAYKGTDSSDPAAAAQDWLANISLGTGIGSLQAIAAAQFYQDIEDNPLYADYAISFTGHSLGGGLASIMAVWFDRKATVFDVAPFKTGAINLLQTLPFTFQDAALSIFQATMASAMFWREFNVTGYSIAGEALQDLRMVIPYIEGHHTPPIRINGSDQIGDGAFARAVDLHSMNLLAAMMISPKLKQATGLLPGLAKWFFEISSDDPDANPYANPLESESPDLLAFLLNDQIAKGYSNPNGLLNRFAADLEKMARGMMAGNWAGMATDKDVELVTRLAIDYYYRMENGFTQDLFRSMVGGTQFDLTRFQVDLGDIQPYSDSTRGLKALALERTGSIPEAQDAVESFIAEKRRWVMAFDSGSGLRGTAEADEQPDFVLGGEKNDVFNAGGGDDLLVGGKGSDTLNGGLGNNVLIGGEGNDVYIYQAENGGNDRIIDPDGGTIRIDGSDFEFSAAGIFARQPGQNIWTQQIGTHTLTLTHNSPWSLQLENGATISLGENFNPESFRIKLVDEQSAQFTLNNTIRGNQDPTSSDYPNDLLEDTAANDLIQSLSGDDYINAYQGGNDRLEGGTGSDIAMGRAGDDVILGGAGEDMLRGDGGRDRLYASEELALNDALALQDGEPSGFKGDFFDGGDDDDTLFGGTGNDALNGGLGGDTIVGGAGNDDIDGDFESQQASRDWSITRSVETVDGVTYYDPLYNNIWGEFPTEGGDDVIYGGGGADWVSASHGNDWADGGTGEDVLFGEGGHDTLLGGNGDDLLSGDVYGAPESEQGNDYLDGGDGDDTLYGEGGDDLLFGGIGQDKLYGDSAGGPQGDDTLDGEAGDDILIGGGGDDTLSGGSGADWLQGDSGTGVGDGNDSLDGEAGNDTLLGEGGDDEIRGGDDVDQIFGGAGQDTLYGDAGNDRIAGDAGGTDTGGEADMIDGGAGDDIIDGQGGDDTLFGGADNDLIAGGFGDDTLDGGDGDDQVQGGIGNDAVSGGSGNDMLFGQDGDDQLDGGEGDDFLIGGIGNDVVSGGSGSDTLYGQDGDDRLDGGDGTDYLIGGIGNDTLNGGAGDDVYYFARGEGIDRISDGSGIDWLALTDITLSDLAWLDVGSLKLVFNDGSAIHLDDFNPDDPYAAGGIEYIQFADGQVRTPQQLIQALGIRVEGTPDNDVLSGTALAEPIHAYEGDDFVSARGGNDTLDLGAGDDWAAAGDGNDQVWAGEGDDTVFGDAGADHLYGEAGNDFLAGGAGNDILEGGDGNDTYLFGHSDGQDTALDGAGADTVQFAGGLDADSVVFTRSGNDLLVSVKDSAADRLTVKDWFDPAGSFRNVVLGNGTVLDRDAVQALMPLNQAPVAAEDAASLIEDSLTVAYGDALANDTDPEGRALRVTNPGTYAGAYGTLALDADGGFSYALDNAATAVQSLAAGQSASERFGYTVSDDDPVGAATASSAIVVTVAGRNDAPVVVADTAGVAEDTVLSAAGNVLANDADIDDGTVLRIAAPGARIGAYGTLALGGDGAYTYALDNGAAAVQSLGRYQQAAEDFGFNVTDGLAAPASALNVTVSGRNDAPVVAAPLPDQTVSANSAYSWQIPAGTFTDIDQGDVLGYGATLADGTPLPSWLAFDAATQTFSGRVPRDATGYLDIRVAATDAVAGHADRSLSLSASDDFRLTFGSSGGGSGGGGNGGGSGGNEGVGNGEDPPPPGHTGNFNDGPGTGPGQPGAQGGNGYGAAGHPAPPRPRSDIAPTEAAIAVPERQQAPSAQMPKQHGYSGDPHGRASQAASWAESVSAQSTPAEDTGASQAPAEAAAGPGQTGQGANPASTSIAPDATASASDLSPADVAANDSDPVQAQSRSRNAPQSAGPAGASAAWFDAPETAFREPAYIDPHRLEDTAPPDAVDTAGDGEEALLAYWAALDEHLEMRRPRRDGTASDSAEAAAEWAGSGGFLGSTAARPDDPLSLGGAGLRPDSFRGLDEGFRRVA
jgi:VCBS repeat-containing protein